MQMKFHTQIDQCQQCSKSTLKGIELICSLSNKKENFYGECKSFSKGITNAEVKNEPILKVKKTENYQSSSHMNYSKSSEDVRSNGEIKSTFEHRYNRVTTGLQKRGNIMSALQIKK